MASVGEIFGRIGNVVSDVASGVGNLIGDVLDGLSSNPDDNSNVEGEVKAKVKTLCEKFPIYSTAI